MMNGINALRCMSRVVFTRSILSRQAPLKISQRFSSNTKVDSTPEEEEFDEPVKYSTSKACQHRPMDTFYRENTSPWYEPLCLSLSTAIFLLYFCVFREENDWDEELKKSLYERVPGLEEQTRKAMELQRAPHKEAEPSKYAGVIFGLGNKSK